MSTYTRRRLLAVAAVLLAAAGIGVAYFAHSGGDSKPAAQSAPIGSADAGSGASAKAGPSSRRHRGARSPSPARRTATARSSRSRAGLVERFAPPHGKGRVALTFDDGPGPYTPQVLAELRSLHVRATFFVIGRNVRQSPDTVRALRNAGMVVGNHSWSHPNLTKLSLARQRAQVLRTQDLLEVIIGQRPRFFRPPMWAWNRATARAITEEGMVGVLFSVDTRDWSRPGVTAIVRQALTAHAGQIIAAPRRRRRPRADGPGVAADRQGTARPGPRAGHARRLYGGPSHKAAS